MSEDDTAWQADSRESWHNVAQRVTQFLDWLVRQPQTTIAVVSHGIWMETLLRLHAPQAMMMPSNTSGIGPPPAAKRVYNTDAYHCEIVSRGGTFVRMQGVRQICEQQQVANACRSTVLS
jgi:Histidine phosphatase superfamily (branch 1)